MKRVPLLIALVLTFSFGLAHAQGGEVFLSNFGDVAYEDPGNPGTYYWNAGPALTFEITLLNYSAATKGITNGFEFGSTTGGTFTPIVASEAVDQATLDTWFDLTHGINLFSVDGAGYDTAGFYGSVMMGPGIPADWTGVYFIIETGALEVGQEYCLDSAYFPPSGTWLWAPTGAPLWGGPYCHVAQPPLNDEPEITNCPQSALTASHCDLATYDFDATDTESDPITFGIVSGPGTIDANTGAWSYSPSLADVGAPIDLVVNACDPFGCSDDCVYTLNFTNEAPVCDFASGPFPIGMGNTFTKALTFDPVDCDPITDVTVTASPAPVGSFDYTAGVFTFNSVAPDDGGVTYTFTFEVTDGNASSTCELVVEVLETEPYEVQIEKVHNAIQGMHHMVDVTVNKGSEELKGFDILVAYDASALTFTEAIEGDVYTECGWEYFEYRYGPNGNCGSACPSGLLRVVGIAETNNGPNHPSCFSPDLAYTLFSLDFLVTDDRTFECMYVPIRFFWMDCGDNSLAYSTQEDPMAVLQGVSRFVYDYGLDPMMEISNDGTGFPTYTGVQAECLVQDDPTKPLPVQFVDFINGGIDIVCADSIDARGDINLNGTSNEIADAVLFSNYFVYGLGVFTVNTAGQIAATDVNADGLTLSVGDLVYIIRVIVGDAVAYSKLSTVEANYTVDAGVVSIDKAMGGAYLVAAGNVTPTLLADNMDLKYNYDGSNTHILVYSMEQGETFQGEFIEAGNIVSAEFATYEGAVAKTSEVPSNYGLAQNYPNPFNPVTNISFQMPNAGDYSLTVYNVTGQVVETFAGTAQAGVTTVTWDAANQASGIYFYKLEANNFSETKKMVLLK